MADIPESHIDLLNDPNFASFTTIAPDGAPENTIVWFSFDGENVTVGTAKGRRKETNIRENKNVALMVLDPQNPYRWIDVRGVVEAVTSDSSYELIDELAKRYAGADHYYGGVAPAELEGTEERVAIRIRPDSVVTYP
jgi:PPOX class probable F420-dependent enzyme